MSEARELVQDTLTQSTDLSLLVRTRPRMTEVSFQGLVANLGFSDESGLQGGRGIHRFSLVGSPPLIGKLRHDLHWRPFGLLEQTMRIFPGRTLAVEKHGGG